MTQNILDLTFADFDKAATERGYKATQYSQTGFFVKSSNGVRCELQKTKGGVNSIGYGSSSAIVDLLKAAVNSVAGPKNHKIAELKGSVNFAHESIEKFFELVTFTETVKLPESKGKGGRPVGSAAAKIRKSTIDGAKADLKKDEGNLTVGKLAGAPLVVKADKPQNALYPFDNPYSPSGSENAEQAIAAIDARETAKASGASKSDADIAAIKAANLARLRKVGNANKARLDAEVEKRLQSSQTVDVDVNEEFDVPAFLMSDTGRQPGAE